LEIGKEKKLRRYPNSRRDRSRAIAAKAAKQDRRARRAAKLQTQQFFGGVV
jgi:hypothetical protein